jgi:hypothetical protein
MPVSRSRYFLGELLLKVNNPEHAREAIESALHGKLARLAQVVNQTPYGGSVAEERPRRLRVAHSTWRTQKRTERMFESASGTFLIWAPANRTLQATIGKMAGADASHR